MMPSLLGGARSPQAAKEVDSSRGASEVQRFGALNSAGADCWEPPMSLSNSPTDHGSTGSNRVPKQTMKTFCKNKESGREPDNLKW